MLLPLGGHSHGHVKTLGQLLLAATMASLTLVATQIGLGRGSRAPSFCLDQLFGLLVDLVAMCWLLVAHPLRWAPSGQARILAFRPHF